MSAPPTSRLRGDEVYHRHALFLRSATADRDRVGSGRIDTCPQWRGTCSFIRRTSPTLTTARNRSVALRGRGLSHPVKILESEYFMPSRKIDKRRQTAPRCRHLCAKFPNMFRGIYSTRTPTVGRVCSMLPQDSSPPLSFGSPAFRSSALRKEGAAASFATQNKFRLVPLARNGVASR